MIIYNIPLMRNRATYSTTKMNRAVLWKGGRTMNLTVNIDWKFVVALGVASASVILAVKLDASGAEQVSIHAVDACKEYAVAIKGNC